MKVIEKVDWALEFECQECKSKLEAELTDVKTGYFGANYGGERPDYLPYLECPVCGKYKMLKWSEVPTNFKERNKENE